MDSLHLNSEAHVISEWRRLHVQNWERLLHVKHERGAAAVLRDDFRNLTPFSTECWLLCGTLLASNAADSARMDWPRHRLVDGSP